jgi:malate dehydrogenase (quinone)
VDFGSLSRQLLTHVGAKGADIRTEPPGHRPRPLRGRLEGHRQGPDLARDPRGGNAKFVFIGAGGGALQLLQKSGIAEGRGYGGFPVSGLFLRTSEPGARGPPPRQGLRPGRRGRPAHVRAAPRHARDRRQGAPPVRSLCGLLAQVPQAGQVHGPAAVHQVRGNNLPTMLNVAKDNFGPRHLPGR